MIAITLLIIASGAIGMKMYGAVQKKHFQSELERLQARLLVSQKLAVAMQADWKGVLKKNGKEWLFETACEEGKARRLAPLHLKSLEIFFDGKKVDDMVVDFFASGQVLPEGVFLFVHKDEKVKWETAKLFQREEGKKLGPLHPND